MDVVTHRLAGNGPADTPRHRDPGDHLRETHAPESASLGATGSTHPEREHTTAPHDEGQKRSMPPCGTSTTTVRVRGAGTHTQARRLQHTVALKQHRVCPLSSSTAEPKIQQPLGSPSSEPGGVSAQWGVGRWPWSLHSHLPLLPWPHGCGGCYL